MLKIRFDEQNVFVSYEGGPWEVHPLTNAWLWMLGTLRFGGTIEVTDDRETLQSHQKRMSFDMDTNTGDMVVKGAGTV